MPGRKSLESRLPHFAPWGGLGKTPSRSPREPFGQRRPRTGSSGLLRWGRRWRTRQDVIDPAVPIKMKAFFRALFRNHLIFCFNQSPELRGGGDWSAWSVSLRWEERLGKRAALPPACHTTYARDTNTGTGTRAQSSLQCLSFSGKRCKSVADGFSQAAAFGQVGSSPSQPYSPLQQSREKKDLLIHG